MVALLKMPKGLSFTNFIGTNAADAEGAERRMFPRKEICARVEGRRLDHTLPALQEPCLKLELRDLSIGG